MPMKKFLVLLAVVFAVIGVTAYKHDKAVKEEAELWAAAGRK